MNQKRIKNKILKFLTKCILDESTQLFDVNWKEYPEKFEVDSVIRLTSYDGRFSIIINGINPKLRKVG